MMENKWKIKLVLLLTILGTIGIISVIPYVLSQGIQPSNPWLGGFVQILQLFLMVLIGVRLQRRTGLRAPILEGFVYERKKPVFSKKWLFIGILVTFIGSLIMVLLDVFVFIPNIEFPDGQIPVTIWWQGLLAMFYGGITEELMLRLFAMTLVVWILARITKREKENIPSSFYIVAIILTSILFGAGHLPATLELFGELSTIIVIRGIVLSGLLGLWFGYLYWKKGLEYAIVAHMSADIFVHVIFMQIFY